MKYLLASIIGILGMAASPAWAGSRVFANLGETITLNGASETDNNGNFPNADPFTLQVFSAAGECLRIAVLSQDADLKATLVGPSGRVWQDDDSNGSLRPLIKAITPTRGWSALAVSQFQGVPVKANFTFQISRFAATDSRCNPTTPVVLSATTRK